MKAAFFDFFNIPKPEFTEILADNLSSSAVAAFFTISATCVIGPIFEEIVFRGILYKRIVQSRVGPLGAIVLPSIIFSLAHLQYSEPLIFIFIFISGCLLSWIRHITGNLWYSIALHCFWNSLVFIDIAYFD
ncbi:CPBP family intramembrane metalloprotease [Salinimonas marina]|uniref:CPBP family intramembrane metalloprotease n=1 Tax=Salinimonas marina TaxID=2785918 RepID=A0A7S9DUY7_9ALTE|nr:CPBP family intramembrane metalloprotease [Salinimonas marina]